MSSHFSQAAADPATLTPKTIRLVNELLAAHLERDLGPEELEADTRFDAIGLDSLDRMDLALEIEQQFGFRSDAVVDTLGQLWALADGRLSTGEAVAGPAAVPAVTSLAIGNVGKRQEAVSSLPLPRGEGGA